MLDHFNGYEVKFARKRHKTHAYLMRDTYFTKVNDECFVIELDSNPIIYIHKEGYWELHSFKTTSLLNEIKHRIRYFTPAYLFQKKYQWYLGTTKVKFFDGIIVDRYGEVVDKLSCKKCHKLFDDKDLRESICLECYLNANKN